MTRHSEMKKQVAVAALTATIVFSITAQLAYSASNRSLSSASAPTVPRRLTTPPARLGTVADFKTAFQNDQGKVRLVALVSPT
jgi:hypothetical protein